MTRSKEEIDAATVGIKESAELAHKMAEFVISETQSTRKAIFASGILYASLASMNGMSMHDAMALLMEVYRKHEAFMKEHGDDI